MTHTGGIYLRLSKENHGDSIAHQKSIIYSYLKKKPEIHLEEEYIDEGFSGSNFQRPAFQRMMSDIRQGRINTVLVSDLSRFGRNFLESERYLGNIFPFLGVRFLSVLEGMDSHQDSSGFRHLLRPMKNLLNEAYLHDISQKIRSQRNAKASQGHYLSAFAPYGYEIAQGEIRQLVSDPLASSVVSLIFYLRLRGLPCQTIADYLMEKGYPTPLERKESCPLLSQKQSQWHSKTVARILSYPRRLSASPAPPLVDEWIYQQLNSSKVRESLHGSPLRGRVYCGLCGMVMGYRNNGSKAIPKYLFFCQSQQKQGTCQRNPILAKPLERSLTHFFSLLYQEETTKDQRILETLIHHFEKKIPPLEERLHQLEECYGKGHLSQEDYTLYHQYGTGLLARWREALCRWKEEISPPEGGFSSRMLPLWIDRVMIYPQGKWTVALSFSIREEGEHG